jgi:predicted O-linked N-acetylglucosamine transferase (SPINDLY family)
VRSDRAHYVRTAIELARERNRLTAAKRRLAERSAPFFDTRARVRDLEDAYFEMWQQARS